jgi:hypothetical protein
MMIRHHHPLPDDAGDDRSESIMGAPALAAERASPPARADLSPCALGSQAEHGCYRSSSRAIYRVNASLPIPVAASSYSRIPLFAP